MPYRTNNEIVQEIIRLRREQNISQQELATTIGLDQSTVSRIEKGQRALAVAELADIAERLHVPVETLLHKNKPSVLLRASETDPQLKRALKTAEKLADSFLYFKALTG
jgi:transcriptional regulator with XRE-family HTH domain